MNLWENKVLPMIQESYKQAQALDKTAQVDAAKIRLAIYHDDWLGELKQKAAEGFSKEKYNQMCLLFDTSDNTLKKTVNQLAKLYKSPPDRKVLLAGPDDENGKPTMIDADTPYGKFVDNAIMQILNQHFVLLNDVGVWVKWDDRQKRCRMLPLNRSNCTVIPRDDFPSDVDAVIIELDNADRGVTVKEPRYLYIDNEQTFEFDKNGTRYELEGAPGMVNPYNIIPCAFAHNGARADAFWDLTGGNDLVEATTLGGIRRTMIYHALKWAAMKRPWIRYDQSAGDPPVAAMFHDMSSVISLTGKDSAAGILDFQIDFNALYDISQKLSDSTLSAYGLNAAMFSGQRTQAESGEALKVRNAGLKEARLDQVHAFTQFEKDIFDIARVVNNIHDPANTIPDDAILTIDYPEMDMFIDDEQERKDDLWDLQTGVISVGQFYMRRNPDVTDEENAERIITENLNKLKQFKSEGFDLLSAFSAQQKTAEQNTFAGNVLV